MKQDGKSKEGLMKKMEETIQNLEEKLKGRTLDAEYEKNPYEVG